MRGKGFDRFGKALPPVAHRESNDIPMRAAAETMEELLVVIDVKTGRLFIMKGAAPFEFSPRPHQTQPSADNPRKRKSVTDFFKEGGGECGHIYKRRSYPASLAFTSAPAWAKSI